MKRPTSLNGGSKKPPVGGNGESRPKAAGKNKPADLSRNKESSLGELLTTNQGTAINDNQNTLKAGARGPSLLEDFIFREKITHFDHERIPERVVHARGTGAHGYFRVYDSMKGYTRAAFLQDPARETAVFVRFSTVAGSRGSTDLARDVRGFAVKFYTDEGVFDLVGNNIPVFFIQDAIKFPDVVHAVKPEPHNEIPQAASAHDTFWDFISLMPESAHMILWLMSDRAIPRSYRMMEGFGVHTFRFVNADGVSRFVKFHWKPVLGMHSVLWDEAQKISGKDPDFHRRDLYEAIENGDYPEFELGVQMVDEKNEHSFDFDLLDATKIIPENVVPVQRIGRLVLNRNPDNFFAETEQVAFHPGHVVPGIDFTADPLLQGRLFSYTDTQLLRLGGPNFHEIPINRPLAPVHNNQRDGFMRQTINKSRAAYEPNTLGGGCPFQAGMANGGFVSFPEKLNGPKIRQRSEKFFDHFSQARLFFNSQSDVEKDHIVSAFRFELGKVEVPDIRKRMIGILTQVDQNLAERVAAGLGLEAVLDSSKPMNQSVPADADPARFQPTSAKKSAKPSRELSILLSARNDTIRTRKIAVLVADGCEDGEIDKVLEALLAQGALAKIVAPRLGYVRTREGNDLKVHFSFLTASSVLFDAVYVPGGIKSVAALKTDPMAMEFVFEAYKHCKAIAASGAGVELLRAANVLNDKARMKDAGIVGWPEGATDKMLAGFVAAIAAHRNWDREKLFRPDLQQATKPRRAG
jgi:catalase